MDEKHFVNGPMELPCPDCDMTGKVHPFDFRDCDYCNGTGFISDPEYCDEEIDGYFGKDLFWEDA